MRGTTAPTLFCAFALTASWRRFATASGGNLEKPLANNVGASVPLYGRANPIPSSKGLGRLGEIWKEKIRGKEMNIANQHLFIKIIPTGGHRS